MYYQKILIFITSLLPFGAAHATQITNGNTIYNNDQIQIATFAGGCFWCVESDFDKLDGVLETTSGYIGGRTKDPTYYEVSEGGTGHTEAVQIKYDSNKVTYAQLLDHFWHNIDPTMKNGQFCDFGAQYRSAIFYHDEEQRKLAEQSRAKLEKTKPFNAPIVTQIVPASIFYPAEERHQDYYQKHAWKYMFYRYTCGRDDRLEKLWGKAG